MLLAQCSQGALARAYGEHRMAGAARGCTDCHQSQKETVMNRIQRCLAALAGLVRVLAHRAWAARRQLTTRPALEHGRNHPTEVTMGPIRPVTSSAA